MSRSRFRRLVTRDGQVQGVGALAARAGELAGLLVARETVRLTEYWPAIASAWLRRRFCPPSTVTAMAGRERHGGGLFAVFVIWQPDGMPWYVRNALAALSRAQVDVVLVCNHDLSAGQAAELASSCHTILVCRNPGRDVGAVCDAVRRLRGEPVSRLLILNDSVYYFRRGLDELIRRLVTSPSDLCAAFENRERVPHFSSFCLSLSDRALADDGVRAFWDGYLPVPSRRWAIHRGEIGLSRALAPFAGTAEVIYGAEEVGRAVVSSPLRHDVSRFLPGRQRVSADASARGETLSAERVASLVDFGSPSHTACFLAQAACSAPLMKRDIVWRDQFKSDEALRLLGEIGDEGHGPEIAADLARKGDPSRLRGRARARWILGLT